MYNNNNYNMSMTNNHDINNVSDINNNSKHCRSLPVSTAEP